MDLLLQLSTEQHVKWGWGDGGASYVFHCPEHGDQTALLWQSH